MKDKDTAEALRIISLLSRHVRDGLTAAEQCELDSWSDEKPENKQLIEEFLNEDYRKSILDKWIPDAAESSLQNIKYKMGQVKRYSLWWRIAVAASILLIAGSGLWLYEFRQDQYDNAVSLGLTKSNDIAPGRNTATLTLSDGRKVVLSDASNGKLAEQAGVVISKTADGKVVYKAEIATANQKINYNILSTAKGETYQIDLPDGTKVWLNAASTLKFPSTFANSANRKVELSGEAYFDVAKDKAHPFLVVTAKQQVEVLGTHFNINSYGDEETTKTTLLEGSVHVALLNTPIINGRNAKNINQLLPGQQSVLTDETFKIIPANLDETMAWKNGYFKFNDESLESIMRKLARWYDVDVAYEGKFENEGFSGKISRSRNISKVLKILESTKIVHFKIEGRRVTVIK